MKMLAICINMCKMIVRVTVNALCLLVVKLWYWVIHLAGIGILLEIYLKAILLKKLLIERWVVVHAIGRRCKAIHQQPPPLQP